VPVASTDIGTAITISLNRNPELNGGAHDRVWTSVIAVYLEVKVEFAENATALPLIKVAFAAGKQPMNAPKADPGRKPIHRAITTICVTILWSRRFKAYHAYSSFGSAKPNVLLGTKIEQAQPKLQLFEKRSARKIRWPVHIKDNKIRLAHTPGRSSEQLLDVTPSEPKKEILLLKSSEMPCNET
jgi:hypothetical protein